MIGAIDISLGLGTTWRCFSVLRIHLACRAAYNVTSRHAKMMYSGMRVFRVTVTFGSPATLAQRGVFAS